MKDYCIKFLFAYKKASDTSSDAILHYPGCFHSDFSFIMSICMLKPFEETFQDDALGTVGNILFGGDDAHAVLAQRVAVEGAVVTVAGETVELPHENHIKELLGAVRDHPLKVGAIVRLCRKCAVYVLPDDLHIVILGVLGALPDLPFNALLSLIVRGIPGVNDCFHLLLLTPF